MNHTCKLALLALSIMGAMGAAHAAIVPETESTQSVTLTFKEPTPPVTLTVTPEANLQSGQVVDGQKFATIVVKATDANKVALQLVDHEPNQPGEATITGASGNNTLKVKIDDPALEPDEAHEMLLTKTSIENGAEFSTDLLVGNGQETVEADEYTVTVKAGMWSE
ncbi:hypothetical protein QOM18_25840 [Serratia marcescens]|uniref:AfaD family invasin n=1 Tax=Serratia marcescens TaxID=615 RepID=UPI0024C4A169|nr:hypothetical protein [Serratia marcescens]MDK1711740.1 hypothetical protein [Serratia marcescens]